MDRVAAWFHLLLALSVGTIVYVTAFGASRRCSSRALHQIQRLDRSTVR
jgi:hypothetical protein